MRARIVAVLFIGSVVVLHAAAAAAQPSSHPRGLQPVSPGSFAAATLAAACPAFSWAGKPGAVGYELAVHRVEDPSQLEPAPVMRATLPGTAATWAPPVSDCLEPGASYMWFVREVGPAGEPLGGWSDGMRFTVAGSPSGETADAASPSGIAVQGNGNGNTDPGKNDGPPPSNREILNRLNDVLDILNEPEPIFSFVLCTEPALNGEVQFKSEVKVEGQVEGRVGAEGFGNGVMARLKGTPVGKFGESLKASWDVVKLGVCWDLGATVRNRRAAAAAGGGTLRAAAAPGDLADIIAGLDVEALRQKLQAAADGLQLDPVRSLDALQGLTDVSFDGDPFAGLRGEGPLRQMAESMPLPEALRELAEKPAMVFERLNELRAQGLCSLDLPPALAGPIGEICDLAANEPFRPLLVRVDKATDTIESIVDRIERALPTSESCKFFCDGGFLGK
jgi:hypothetical protein